MKSGLLQPSPRKHIRLLSLLLAAALALTLCACGGGEKTLLEYQNQNFRAQVHGEWRGTAFEGELVHTVPDDGTGESGAGTQTTAAATQNGVSQGGSNSGNTNSGSVPPPPAAVTLTFTAPAAWCGITLTLSGDSGTATMALGDLSYDMTGDIGGTWFEIPALFTAEGEITAVTAADGGLTVVTFNAPSMGSVRVIMDGETRAVKRIEGACGWVEVE